MANAISSTGNFVHSLRSTPARGAFAKRHINEGVAGKAISGDGFQISGVWGSKRLPEPEAFSNPRTGADQVNLGRRFDHPLAHHRWRDVDFGRWAEKSFELIAQREAEVIAFIADGFARACD